MINKLIPTFELTASQLPPEASDPEVMTGFALTFNGYEHWGSFSRCAEIANSQDRGSIDKIRTCLFFEARRWHHFGKMPDEESIDYWRSLVEELRLRLQRLQSLSADWLSTAIRQLNADETDGHRLREQWLEAIDVTTSTAGGTVFASVVYDSISDPTALMWLATASRIDWELLQKAWEAACQIESSATPSSVIRQFIPWCTLAEKLEATQTSSRTFESC